MHVHQPPEDSGMISAFRKGLHDSLVACSQILCSPNYLEFLRAAFEQGEDDILRKAVYAGHDGIVELLSEFLVEAAKTGIIRELDYGFAAEMLLGQIQGNDFIHILFCRHGVEPGQWRQRIDAAVAAFCKTNLALP